MRVVVGKTLRVGPGDEVVIRGSLPKEAKLGRLFVFASENGAEFSPYALNIADMLVSNGKPVFLQPLSLRLVPTQPERHLSFVADIDGYVRVMQEVDTANDPKAKVKLTRRINPNLGWIAWMQRKIPQLSRPKLTS